MADKYLARIAGKSRQKTPVTASTGAADAGKIIALDSAGKLPISMLPDGVGADLNLATASESLSAGAFVNLFSNSGVFSARLADHTNGRSADGFVLEAVAASAQATVYQLGEVNSGLSGLIVGADYYLGTAGGTINTPLDGEDDNNAGYVDQYLGKAKSATELVTVYDDPVVL
jgi:hypothetical protein